NDTALNAMQANAPIQATAATGILGGGAGHELAIYVGAMTDTSLVSTTNAAAGLAAALEYQAVFFGGNATAQDLSA
ncbi:MAG: hypothetical protein MK009_12145, partial [Gammaproteobacteria bacterium]|nr:hypothetical protein [Gammaproteobacteria bacterium]